MPESILVVDDDEGLLEVCEVGLRHAGYQVSTCSTGDQAVQCLDTKTLDLVLTDLAMPGKTDGHGVVLAVKAKHPSTEVVVMTATPTLNTAIATLKDGAYDYVVKPFHFDDLLATVRRCLDHRRLRHDLSSERAMRQELEAAYKELQKVEQLKESFLARVSHELKTPLSEVMIALQILDEAVEKSVIPAEKPVMEKYAGLARKGAKRMERTISELLAFIDLQKDQKLKYSSPVDLEKLCRETVERLKPLWEPRRLSMELKFQTGLPPFTGDPELLARAFEYLIHNAIAFNREGGRVTIHGESRQGRLAISVADTGEGIPESEFDNIFDSFYQIANYLTRRVEGLGLGLATTRRIVEAHHGEISVRSKLGEGTTFTVTLPPGR